MARIVVYILGVVGLLGLALLGAAGMLPMFWILILGSITLCIVVFLIWQVDGKTPID